MDDQQRELAERQIKSVLTVTGNWDDDDLNLTDTPRRVVKWLEEIKVREPFEWTKFPADGADQMIVVSDIDFSSNCAHHLLPFMGRAVIAYVPHPDNSIAGLSKFARCVEYHAAGLQNQERITKNIADDIMKNLGPTGVAVALISAHTCMSCRGVKSRNAITTTTELRGVFRAQSIARQEFMNILK